MYATLVAELRALDADIEAARAIAPRATHADRLGVRPHRADAHPPRGEHVRVADGAEVVIRPVEAGDVDALRTVFEHLGAVSRFRQFRGGPDRPTMAELARMAGADHAGREALVALVPETGEGVGVAGYVRSPGDPSNAELICAVADRWQRRGVGTALAVRLAARARAAGIERFTAAIVVGDEAPRRLLRKVASEIGEHRHAGTVEIVARRRDAPS